MPPDRPVAVDGQQPGLPTPPGLGQGVRQQRQGARLPVGIAHDQVDQPWLESQSGDLGGTLDRLAQPLTRERRDEVQPALGEPGELASAPSAATWSPRTTTTTGDDSLA